MSIPLKGVSLLTPIDLCYSLLYPCCVVCQYQHSHAFIPTWKCCIIFPMLYTSQVSNGTAFLLSHKVIHHSSSHWTGYGHSPLETGNPLPAATPTVVHPAALTCVSLYAPMLTTSIELIRVMNNFVSLMPRHQQAWRMTRYGSVSLKVTVYTN